MFGTVFLTGIASELAATLLSAVFEFETVQGPWFALPAIRKWSVNVQSLSDIPQE
jgi:hypothetical protein